MYIHTNKKDLRLDERFGIKILNVLHSSSYYYHYHYLWFCNYSFTKNWINNNHKKYGYYFNFLSISAKLVQRRAKTLSEKKEGCKVFSI